MIPSEVFTTYRPTLLAIAYRMTGQVMVSEDIVQEVILRWMNRPPENVLDLKAYLAKSVTNGCLTYLAQKKREREAYKGVWLPEPLFSNTHVVDAKIDVSYGFMLLLEKLSSLERAVFILKESFDFAYSELAQLFAITEANCRQLNHRAKEKITATNRRFAVDPGQQQELLKAFTKASETGYTELLIQLLKTDVALYSDGGGKVTAASKPLVGLTKVALFLRSTANKFGHHLQVTPALVNGEVGLLFTDKDSQLLNTVLVIESDLSGISQLYFVRNPDKLVHLQ